MGNEDIQNKQEQNDAPDGSALDESEDIFGERSAPFGQASTTEETKPGQDNPEEQKEEETTSEDEEWVIPGKFKTIEDARKGFKQTEQYLKKLEAERKELRDLIEKVAPALQEEESEGADETKSLKEQFYEAFEEDPVGVLSTIAEYVAELKMQDIRQDYHIRQLEDIEQRVQQLYPDFDLRKHDEIIAEELEKYPEEFRYKSPELALKNAVRDAIERLEKSSDKIQKAKQEGIETGINEVNQKLTGSNTITSRPTTGTKKSPEQIIAEQLISAGSSRSVFA